MSVRYALLKMAAQAVQSQRIMEQPYEKLQRMFGTAKAAPKFPSVSDPDFDVEVFQVTGRPVARIRPKAPTGKACVYLFGGGMLSYPKKHEIGKLFRMARATGREMILPYYPLAPHTLPEVYEMLYALYKALLQSYSAQDIALLGVSSGGNLALGLISHIRARGEDLPMPGKVYASSPGTMLDSKAEAERAERLDKTDRIMSTKALKTIFDGMTTGRDVPGYMKYLQRGDYTGLREAYLCFGGDEVFSAAVASVKRRMEECGTAVTLEIGEGLYHCYSTLPLVPEARQGYDNMLAYLSAKG